MKIMSFLVFAMILLLAGCGGESGSINSYETIATEEIDETINETVNETQNLAPISVAGADQTILEGTSVTLDGSASNDNDGEILVYQWKKDNEILVNNVSITLSNLALGIHTFTLTVVDNDIASHTDEIVITVAVPVLTYETIQSPHTGKIWLDRNIGATQVCTSYDDVNCYGDYFQWGRESDDHEDSISDTLTTLSTKITNIGNKFIVSTADDEYDWSTDDIDGSQRSFNWSKIDGSSVCPLGFRVPTVDELNAEMVDISSKYDVFDSFLKLPLAGYRYYNGNMNLVNKLGRIWSSNSDGSTRANAFFYHNTDAYTGNSGRANAYNIRCIQD